MLTAGLVLGGDSSRGWCKFVPNDWKPSLEQVQEELECDLATKP